ncbi:MAG: DUF4271 domain-containing protein [Bacteroidota bacterium]
MKNRSFFILFFLVLAQAVFCQIPGDTTIISAADSIQVQDSVLQNDSLQQLPPSDSVSKRPKQDTGWLLRNDIPFSSRSVSRQIMEHHPWFGFATAATTKPPDAIRKFAGKEWLFYLLLALLITFGFLRNLFPKYFSDLFRLFFRTTIKQRQIKEQLMQTPLPSLLLNGFYVISASLYISMVLQHFDMNPAGNFWLLALYCSAGLSAIYIVKFIGLKITGWLFNMQEAADAYIFIVFVVNKMIGILLLPFLVLIAFAAGEIYPVAIVLSWCLVGGLFIYRFILTYTAVRNQVKVNPFHFFLYLCAFEIAPLLLIYKGLLLFFRITA